MFSFFKYRTSRRILACLITIRDKGLHINKVEDLYSYDCSGKQVLLFINLKFKTMWIVIFFIGMLVGIIITGFIFIAMEGYFTIVKNEEVETKTIYEKSDITSDVVVLGYCKVHKITYKNGSVKYKTYDI